MQKLVIHGPQKQVLDLVLFALISNIQWTYLILQLSLFPPNSLNNINLARLILSHFHQSLILFTG